MTKRKNKRLTALPPLEGQVLPASKDQEAGETPKAPSLPLVLHVEKEYYALVSANTTGSASVVWRTRHLRRLPEVGVEVLSLSAETRTRLIQDAVAKIAYADFDPSGELFAIKIALPGKEATLEKEVKALQRLGATILRLQFPGFNQPWPENFPCLIMEWVEGEPLSQRTDPFSEPDGLQICLQLANLLYIARLSAPDVILTDSLNAENVFVVKEANQPPLVRLLGWGAYERQENLFRERTLIRFGEVMAGIFAPALGFKINRAINDPLLEELGKGASEDLGATQWDTLTYGTRTLIRRVLQRDFEGGADAIISNVRQSIQQQVQNWAAESPHLQAQIEVGAARLNWLDIAAARGERISEDERRQLLYQVLDVYGKEDQHFLAFLDLRTALRRYPQDASFRWAFLFHTIARASRIPRAYLRLRLGETLAAMREASFELARALLDSRRNQLPHHEADPLTASLISALFNRIDILRLAPSTLRALQEEWQIEEAEATLLTLTTLQSQSEEWEWQVLPGADPATGQVMEALRTAIIDYHNEHADYEAAIERPELLSSTRKNKFEQSVQRAMRLGGFGLNSDADDLVLEALTCLDQAETGYPDLWEAREYELTKYRLSLQNFLVTQWNERARHALQKEGFRQAAQVLQMVHRIAPDTHLIQDTLTVLEALQQAQKHYHRAEYSLAAADLEPAIDLAWDEILPVLTGGNAAAKIGDKIQQVREIQHRWPASVPHAAQTIHLCIQVYREADTWQGPIHLHDNVATWQQEAVRYWEQGVDIMRDQMNFALQHSSGEAVSYQRVSYLHYIQAAQDTLRQIDEEKFSAESPLTALRTQLDLFWRKAQTIYSYDRTLTLIEAREYAEALAPGRDADKLHLDDPLVNAARIRVSEVVSVHLQKEWEAACKECHKRKEITQPLADLFARFSQADSPAGSLAEAGNRFLEKGNINILTPALEFLFAPVPTHQTCAEFGIQLARYRPDDCRFWFYHYALVAHLVAHKRYVEALEIETRAAIEQKKSTHLKEQREEACLAVKDQLREWWLARYQEMTGRGPIALTMQKGLALQGLSLALVKLADDLMPSPPPPSETALALAGALYADDQGDVFGGKMAAVRPADYKPLLAEINSRFENHTQIQLREAALAIYAQVRGDKLRLDVRHALTYVFTRVRLRQARQSLNFAARIAPTPALARRVGQARLGGWLVSLTTLALLSGLVSAIWILLS